MDATRNGGLVDFDEIPARSVGTMHTCCCHALVEDLFADEE